MFSPSIVWTLMSRIRTTSVMLHMAAQQLCKTVQEHLQLASGTRCAIHNMAWSPTYHSLVKKKLVHPLHMESLRLFSALSDRDSPVAG